MQLPRDLVEAVRRHHLIPFVGAGVSSGIKSGLFPGWKSLLEGLASELEEQGLPAQLVEQVRQEILAKNFLDAAELALTHLGAHRFNRYLRQRIRFPRQDDADLSVVRAIWDLRPSLVLTTNYDDVLTWSCERVEQLANDQMEELALMHAEEGPETPRVWHLHGTIHRLSTLILGGSDYERLYGPTPAAGDAASELTRQQEAYRYYAWALQELDRRLSMRPFLYIGFSFNDAYVLRQVKHVLQKARGKTAPSFALMKKGEGDRAHLWSSYNIQLIEYEDHGKPLAALLGALRRRAFGEPSPVMSAPVHTVPAPTPHMNSLKAPLALTQEDAVTTEVGIATEATAQVSPLPPQVPRPYLVKEYAQILQRERKLVLLASRRGGARSLARQVAKLYGPRVTWLAPPNHPDASEADYCRALAGDEKVTSFEGLTTHLRLRAAGLGGEHLLVLRYEWGPIEQLKKLGNYLRQLLEERAAAPFHVLVAGGIRSAWMIHHVDRFSAFKDAPRREVPDFTVDEVRQLLVGAKQDGRWASALHEATGGHLGLLMEVVVGGGPFDAKSVTERLVRSPVLRETVRERLRDDMRERRLGHRHAKWVLAELLAGREVLGLDPLDQQTQYAEVRLFFDGIVRRDHTGHTVLMCEAVARVAREALARQDGTP